MLAAPVLDAFRVVDSVISVLHYNCDLEPLFELAAIHEIADEFRGCAAQHRGGAQCSERVLVAFAEDGRCYRAGGDPWSLVAVRHHRLRLAKRGRVAAKNGG